MHPWLNQILDCSKYLVAWDCRNLVMLNHRFQPIQVLALLVSTRYTLLTYCHHCIADEVCDVLSGYII
ncbi:hypothetical protein MKW92_025658 [Papaver armeniacum]|nr:hypothetical protein MKW92_025658 [Papaver armeniacum]